MPTGRSASGSARIQARLGTVTYNPLLQIRNNADLFQNAQAFQGAEHEHTLHRDPIDKIIGHKTH